MKASKSKIAVPKKNLNFENLKFDDDNKSFRTLFENILDEKINCSTKIYNDPLDEYKVIVPVQGNFWDNGYEDIEINSVI